MQNTELDRYFIIEVCENCRSHNWNTRHDEAKYKQYGDESNHIHTCLLPLLIDVSIFNH